MKFIHLSDLHLGKRWNEYSLLEDQKYILEEILKIISYEKPDGIIIAGDVYDKSIPSAEAVELFDAFLVQLAELKLSAYIISGNHDSVERLSFGGRIMSASNIYISPSYTGKISPIIKKDEHGTINIYLLPFVKPANIRKWYPDCVVDSYNDALNIVIKEMQIDTNQRNILIAHQFITGAQRCESETISVGGLDNIDVGVFADFDYVALGHIHSSQNIGSEKVRYCGTPLKYSLSEINNAKSVTMDALIGLSNSNRLVGIISHVFVLKERIDKQIIVKKDRFGGSHAEISV